MLFCCHTDTPLDPADLLLLRRFYSWSHLGPGWRGIFNDNSAAQQGSDNKDNWNRSTAYLLQSTSISNKPDYRNSSALHFINTYNNLICTKWKTCKNCVPQPFPLFNPFCTTSFFLPFWALTKCIFLFCIPLVVPITATTKITQIKQTQYFLRGAVWLQGSGRK